MKIVALCHTCRHQHNIDFDPQVGPGAAFGDWQQKHAFHDIDYEWRERSYKIDVDRQNSALEYLHNADVKLSYAASAAYTITLASLATSSTLVAGRESDGISNTSNNYIDYIVGGKVTTGTSPTTNKTIQVCAIGSVNDTPLYPDVFDGTDSAETFTSADIKNAIAKYVGATNTDNTSDRTYWFGPVSLANVFGGIIPRSHVLWVGHDTAVNLNSTGSNHALYYNGVYMTVV